MIDDINKARTIGGVIEGEREESSLEATLGYSLPRPQGSESAVCYSAPYELIRATPGAIGFDLRAQLGESRQLAPGRRWKAATGVRLALMRGFGGFVMGRSGLAMHHGIICHLGVIDADYRGEISAILINHGTDAYTINPGERIAQLVIAPVWMGEAGGLLTIPSILRLERVDKLGDTTRGESGFGSTGR